MTHSYPATRKRPSEILCQKCSHSIDIHRDNMNGRKECDRCRCRRTQWYIAKQDRLAR